jgi:DNA polymerase-4
MKKPNGLTFIGPSRIESFMENLPVEKFFGVGRVTAAKMKSLHLHTGADLKKLSEAQLIEYFGKAGAFFYKIVRGIDDRPVQPHRETKSLGAEDTFSYDLVNIDEMNQQLDKIAKLVHERLAKHQLKGRTITLKIKYSDFKLITRSQSFSEPQSDPGVIQQTAKQLLAITLPAEKGIRLLGISLSNFGEKGMLKESNNQLILNF